MTFDDFPDLFRYQFSFSIYFFWQKEAKMDPKSDQNGTKNHSKIDAKKGTKKKGLKRGGAEVAVSPNPIISKDILRSEVRRKYTKKTE